jgi:Rieske Fe-S protein
MSQIKRRDFIAGGTAAAVGAGACACGLGCASLTGVGDTPEIAAGAYMIEGARLRIALDQTPELDKVGGSVKVTDGNLTEPLIIARVADREYVVAAIKCAHRGVEVEYKHKDKNFKCASLGSSRYSLAGSKIKGPAKGPLKIYEVSLGFLDKNKLVVKL